MVDPFRVRVVGPLSSQAHGFAAELIRLGYSPRTTRDHVYVLAQLSRWLADGPNSGAADTRGGGPIPAGARRCRMPQVADASVAATDAGLPARCAGCPFRRASRSGVPAGGAAGGLSSLPGRGAPPGCSDRTGPC